MNTEEKAKAYDKALDDIRAIYPNLKGDAKLAVEHAFPELAESEDERIRKALVIMMKVPRKEIFEAQGITKEQAIAYLEKQKDLAAIPDELVKNYKLFCANGCREVAMLINAINCINEQKEQRPINNSTREKIISRATSEKQVVLLSESNGNAEIGWDTRSLEDAKKLLEYGIAFINERLGTKPAEWSDEDERILKGVIGLVDHNQHYGVSNEEMISWLKSLRPQPHWKPSEEQEPEYYQHFDPDC